MGIASHHVIPNIIPPTNLAAAAGIFTGLNGRTSLGERVGGILNGIEKISFYFDVTALSAGTLTLNVDSSIDGQNFTSGGKIASVAITAVGNYRVDYIGAPVSILQFSWELTAGDTATVESIGLEGSLI